jgi:hypothetical protein
LTLKRNLLLVAIVMFGSLGLAERQWSYAADLNNLLKGNYAFQTSGTALLSQASPSGCVASGVDVTVVPAALHGTLSFDGNGNITSSTKLGFDIAGTVCNAINYQVTGTYDVQSKGHGAFDASGILGVSSQSPFAQCGLTFVTGINLSLTGNISEHSIMIGTFGAGAGSSFARGTCTATVQDFVSSGNGSLQ